MHLTNTIKRSICVLGMASLIVTGASAQTKDMKAKSMDQVPTLTKERFLKNSERRFDRLDANKDGVVDKAESDASVEKIVTRIRERMTKHFNDLDTKKDGRITRDAFKSDATKVFEETDTNKDGALDRKERRDYAIKKRREAMEDNNTEDNDTSE